MNKAKDQKDAENLSEKESNGSIFNDEGIVQF